MKSVLLLCSILCLVACKQRVPDNQSQSELVVEIPEDFIEFYELFHADSIYQMQHINFPLSGKSDTTMWQVENWDLHHPINNSSGEFSRSFDNFQNIIVETIEQKQGLFNMVRRFSKLGEEWHLIYYNVKTISLENPDG